MVSDWSENVPALQVELSQKKAGISRCIGFASYDELSRKKAGISTGYYSLLRRFL